MRSMRGALLHALCLALLGCSQDPRVVRVELLAPEAIGCRPFEVRSIVVTPLADSPSSSRPSIRLGLAGGTERLDFFAPETERVAVRAEGVVRMGAGTVPWVGGGIAAWDPGSSDTATLLVPLLQLRRSCVLGDASARMRDGAAAVALDDGRLLVAGGHDAALLVSPGVLFVRPGERLVRAPDAARLFVPRTGATATALTAELVVVAGGAGAAGGSAYDSFEVLRVTEGVEERVPLTSLLARARRDHAAASLPDGRVLLVGGREGATGALGDAELLRVEVDGTEASSTLTASRPLPRAEGRVLVLDDGAVLVVGGVDAAGEPVPTVERFDPSIDTFVALDAGLAPRADAAWVAVRGARAARVGGRNPDGMWSRDVDVLIDGGAEVVTLADRLAPVESPVAIGLPDGRVLVIGLDPVSRRAAAQLVDPGGSRDESEREEDPVEPSRLASHLIELADGSIAEADGEGMSLLRLDTSTLFDDPSANIFPAQMDQRAELALDAARRWRAEGDRLVAQVDGARLDLPRSRFLAFEARLSVSGPLEVLLTSDGRAPTVITVDDTAVSFGECRAERGGGAEITVTRDRASLTLATDVAEASCALVVPGRVGIAIRAAEGSGVERIAVTRL